MTLHHYLEILLPHSIEGGGRESGGKWVVRYYVMSRNLE